ncbi:MAG: efflux RND transporter periplasmic adaptor subunit [Pseudomonadales bacterium]
MFLRLALTAVAIGLVIAGVLAYRQQQNAAGARAVGSGPPPAVVTDTRVQRLLWAQRIEAVGDITAIQDVAVASEVTGKVVEINFSSGAAVAQGDVLVRLDAADERAQLEALQADLKLAQLENDRVLKLRGTAAFSQAILDRTQSQMASLGAQAQRQQVLLQRKVLRAPFDGVLGIRQVSLGDIVAPGQPIVRLQTLDPIYVDFAVPERHRGSLAPGQTLELSVAAWPDQVFSGALIVVSPDVDVRSRTLKLRGQLDNPDGRLQPGMFATVHLILSGDEPVLTLPRTAISFFAYGESVFRIDESGDRLTAHRQAVKVGRTRAEQVEILSGLEAGQRVVHTGHLKLREGQSVVIGEGVPLPEAVGDR